MGCIGVVWGLYAGSGVYRCGLVSVRGMGHIEMVWGQYGGRGAYRRGLGSAESRASRNGLGSGGGAEAYRCVLGSVREE